MKIILFRPGVDDVDGMIAEELLQAFKTMTLVDKTVVGDEIVYIFK